MTELQTHEPCLNYFHQEPKWHIHQPWMNPKPEEYHLATPKRNYDVIPHSIYVNREKLSIEDIFMAAWENGWAFYKKDATQLEELLKNKTLILLSYQANGGKIEEFTCLINNSPTTLRFYLFNGKVGDNQARILQIDENELMMPDTIQEMFERQKTMERLYSTQYGIKK